MRNPAMQRKLRPFFCSALTAGRIYVHNAMYCGMRRYARYYAMLPASPRPLNAAANRTF